MYFIKIKDELINVSICKCVNIQRNELWFEYVGDEPTKYIEFDSDEEARKEFNYINTKYTPELSLHDITSKYL